MSASKAFGDPSRGPAAALPSQHFGLTIDPAGWEGPSTEERAAHRASIRGPEPNAAAELADAQSTVPELLRSPSAALLERALVDIVVTRALVDQTRAHFRRDPSDVVRAITIAVAFVAGAEALPRGPLDLDLRAVAYAFLAEALDALLDPHAAEVALDTARAYYDESCRDPSTSFLIAVTGILINLHDELEDTTN